MGRQTNQRAIDAIFACEDIPCSSTMVIMVVLGSFSDGNTGVVDSLTIEELGNHVCLTRRSVIRCIKKLVEASLLIKERGAGKRRNNVYVIPQKVLWCKPEPGSFQAEMIAMRQK